jgi:hypothetical membrane protein
MRADAAVRVAISWLVATLVAAHVLAPDSYSLVTNTMSELGAQNTENAWVARAGYIGFGVLLACHYSGDLVHVRRVWAQALLLLLYGSTIALTGVFSTAPFEGGVFSEPESLLHSVFATLAGAFLSAAIFIAAWRALTRRSRWRHAGSLAFVALASALFAAIPEYRGISQRALWLGGLWWLGCVDHADPQGAPGVGDD